MSAVARALAIAASILRRCSISASPYRASTSGSKPANTAGLYARWPDRVAEVIGYDEERAWLLLADAGRPVDALGNPPQAWLAALPRYAELQRGEAARAREHLARGVPDVRPAALAARYDELLSLDLPIGRDDACRVWRSAWRGTGKSTSRRRGCGSSRRPGAGSSATASTAPGSPRSWPTPG